MVQVLNQKGSLAGRIGAGFGEGFSEQAPKEFERYRMAQGLEKFQNQSGGRSPIQNLAAISSIPGVTPQMIQSFGELSKQQAQANALANRKELENRPPPSPFPDRKRGGQPGSDIPSITQPKPLEQIQEGYIPPTYEQKLDRAGELYNANPGLYQNNPQLAIDAVDQEETQKKAITEAYEKKHQNLTDIQDNVVNRLKAHSERLGVNKVPANVYSKVEDEAIKATKPKKDGGGGLTEQQAMKKYGDKLDEINRQYEAVDTIGNWGMTARKPSSTLRNIESLQKDFKKRDDTENFADTLIDSSGLSPLMAYSMADPVKEYKQLNSYISKLPRINDTKSEDPAYETEKISENLFNMMGEGSPLAIAYELKRLGYDPNTWLDYVTKNKDKLKVKQGRQVDKPVNVFGTLNDWWLSSWSGIEKEGK